MELTILMPCLNEENTIVACIEQAAAFLHTYGIEGEILVSDNGSEDTSVRLAGEAGATFDESIQWYGPYKMTSMFGRIMLE